MERGSDTVAARSGKTGRNEAWLLAAFPVKDDLSRPYLTEIFRGDHSGELSTRREDGELNSKGDCLVRNLTEGVPQCPHIWIHQSEKIAYSL